MRRQLAAVFFLSGLAQFAAFAKSVLIAYYFGIGKDLDGYFLAQALPVTLAGIVAGFLQTGLLPIYAGHVARQEFDAAASLLARILVAVAVFGAIVSVATSVASPYLISWIAPEVSAPVHQAAVWSLRVLAFLLLLNALVDCLSIALNAHGAFVVAALAPTINALVSGTLLFVLPEWGLANLIWGALIGLVGQLALVAYEIRRQRIRLLWKADADLKPVALAGASIVPGLIFAQLSGLIPQIVAARLGDGAVATFAFAMRLHGALVQVLAIALSTVLLPHFAHIVGRGEHRLIAGLLRKGFPIFALLSLAVLIWIGLVGGSFVAVVFERGEFDHSATASVTTTWLWLAAGLLPTTWGIVLARYC